MDSRNTLLHLNYEKGKRMNENEFFPQATLRICGNLEIEEAFCASSCNLEAMFTLSPITDYIRSGEDRLPLMNADLYGDALHFTFLLDFNCTANSLRCQ